MSLFIKPKLEIIEDVTSTTLQQITTNNIDELVRAHGEEFAIDALIYLLDERDIISEIVDNCGYNLVEAVKTALDDAEEYGYNSGRSEGYDLGFEDAHEEIEG